MSFHDVLIEDHDQITRALDGMVECARGGDREALTSAWDRFEVHLLGHMNGEEMFMLPALREHDPKRAAEIAEDHQRIREVIAKIGLGIDLHVVRDEHIEELKRRLDQHARAEEVDFYRWADERVPADALGALRRRLARAGASIV